WPPHRKCVSHKPLTPALSRGRGRKDGPLSPRERARVRGHLPGCGHCETLQVIGLGCEGCVTTMSEIDPAKLRAAEAAAALVEEGMVVGLGSGTTACAMVVRLGERVAREALRFVGVPTS